MTDYQYAKQLQMWKDTNYNAQKEQLKMAGLNPGLIYGMSGGGATTTGSGSGSVTGANAPTGGREVQDIIGMGIQSALLKAQKENIEANTAKTKAETENVPLTGRQTTAGTELTQLQSKLAKIEAEIKKISEEIAQGWEKLRQSGKQLTYEEWGKAIHQQVADFQTTHPNIEQIKGNLLDELIRGLRKIANIQ